jgi:hypothetical protein
MLRIKYFFALPLLSNPSVNEDVMAVTCTSPVLHQASLKLLRSIAVTVRVLLILEKCSTLLSSDSTLKCTLTNSKNTVLYYNV